MVATQHIKKGSAWSTAVRGGCRLGMVWPGAEVALGHPHTYKM